MTSLPVTSAAGYFFPTQELNANQNAVIYDFDPEGLSVAFKFTSEEIDPAESLVEDEGEAEGSMTTYVVRGMVSAGITVRVACDRSRWEYSECRNAGCWHSRDAGGLVLLVRNADPHPHDTVSTVSTSNRPMPR